MLTTRKIPIFYIGKENTNNMIKNFMATKYPALNDTLPEGREDTRSIWYDIDHFEELYKELIYLNADGIRLYLGAYPEGTLSDMGEDMSNQLCIIMVPTSKNKKGQHADVMLEETPTFGDRPGCERFRGEPEDNFANVKGYDQGGPCPPCCKDQVFAYPY